MHSSYIKAGIRRSVNFLKILTVRYRGIDAKLTCSISARGRMSVSQKSVVEISDNVWILRGYNISVEGNSKVIVGRNVHFGENLRIQAMNGSVVQIDDDVWINHDVEIVARCSIHIGRNTRIGPHVYVIDHDHEVGYTDSRDRYIDSPVNIGSECWIGAHSIILAGVCVGDCSVVGAGAVVTKTIPTGQIWAGVPAKAIGVVS